jgi:hypothetical protein
MKKIMIAVIVSLLLMQHANALQQIVGPLVISVPIGGSGYAEYGLINDGNETITISLRAEGDVAKYLSFPKTVDLVPHKIVYTTITATIPEDYDTSLGGNITGYVYALQEGKPGMVKINVQLKKTVTIIVPGVTASGETKELSIQPTEELKQMAPVTGLVSLVSANSLVTVLFVVLVVVILIVVKIKKGGGEKI